MRAMTVAELIEVLSMLPDYLCVYLDDEVGMEWGDVVSRNTGAIPEPRVVLFPGALARYCGEVDRGGLCARRGDCKHFKPE